MKNLVLASRLDMFAPKLQTVFDKPISELDVLCVPTAAYGQEDYSFLENEMAPLKNQVKSFTEFDLSGKDKQQVSQALLGKDLLYVTGGNSYYLLEQVQKSGFSEAVQSYLETGGQYLGTSAGAILACPRIDFIGDMDDISKASLTNFSALGLIDFYVMPHMDHPTYVDKIGKCIDKLQSEGEKVIGLCDNQALWVQGNDLTVL